MRFISIICWLAAVFMAFMIMLAANWPTVANEPYTAQAAWFLFLVTSVPLSGLGYFLWGRAGKNEREQQADMIARAIAASKEQA